jgi:hypothetical protein
MQSLALLLAIFLAAASVIHIGPPAPAEDGPNMSLAEEIAHERAADIAAANLGDVWLEPADFPDESRAF